MSSLLSFLIMYFISDLPSPTLKSEPHIPNCGVKAWSEVRGQNQLAAAVFLVHPTLRLRENYAQELFHASATRPTDCIAKVPQFVEVNVTFATENDAIAVLEPFTDSTVHSSIGVVLFRRLQNR